MTNVSKISLPDELYEDDDHQFNEYGGDYDLIDTKGDRPYQETVMDSVDDDLEKPDIANKIYLADDTDNSAFCEPYRGQLCRHLIGNRLIYVTSSTQQENTERLLLSSSTGIDFDDRLVTNNVDACKEASMFLACINAFPLCDEQHAQSSPVLKMPRVRQLCLSDCLYIEKDACKFSKKQRSRTGGQFNILNNPFQRMKIPTCTELPPSSSHADCLSLSELKNLSPRIDHQCYNTSTDHPYLGVVSQSKNGRPCLPWNSVISSKKPEVAHLSYAFHPELGNHQYCRNPRQSFTIRQKRYDETWNQQKPWCFIDGGYSGSNPVAEPCAIPLCSDMMGASSIAGIRSELWMVILPSIMVPASLAILLLIFYLLCCRKWRSKARDNDNSSKSVGSKTGSQLGPRRQVSYGTTFLSSNPNEDESSDLLENRRYPSQMTSMGGSSGGAFAHSYSREPMVFTEHALAQRSPPVVSSALIRPIMHNRRSKQTMLSDTCHSPLLPPAKSHFDEFASNACKEIPYHHIRFLFELGQGRYGPCFIGEITQTPSRTQRCLVKTLKDTSRLDQFLSECGALTSCPVKHPHVCALLGLCSEPPATLFDHLTFDLHELLVDPECNLAELFSLLSQVAAAMVYLSGRQMVHKDIAARNVLVDDSKQTAKLSFDVGQCRSQYTRDYYRLPGNSQQMLPIRWMAPEAVSTGVCTSHSDAWSYGVLIWEFYSKGARPYDGHTNPEVIERLRDRCHLRPPMGQPQPLKNIMLECWFEAPCDRPSFTEIFKMISKLPNGCSISPMTYPPEVKDAVSLGSMNSADGHSTLNAVQHFKV